MLNRFVIFLAIAFAGNSELHAEEFCAVPLAVGGGVSTEHWGSQTEVLTVPGFANSFIKLGRNDILTIKDGALTVFDGPPLSNWNRLMPKIIIDRQGETWAYTTIRNPALFRLTASGEFERHGFSNLSDLDALTDPDWRRTHSDRTDRRRLARDGPLFAVKSGDLYRIVGTLPTKVKMPPGWDPRMSAPIDFDGLGEFANVGGRIWFRTGSNPSWEQVARIKDLQSLYSQSPFAMFDVSFDDDSGRLLLLLEDRALVGRFDADLKKPVFDYQFSGDIVLHPASGRVLVWAREPLTQGWRDAPTRFTEEEGLWEMSPEVPTKVSGFQAKARRVSGGIPFMSFVFHEPSGLTLTSHSHGFAAYDGINLFDLPELQTRQRGVDDTRRLRKIGNSYFAKSHETLVKIQPDLSVLEIVLPEPVERLWDIVFSDALGSYFLFSSGWENTYSTKDFVTFSAVRNAPLGIRSLSGDVASANGLLGNSDSDTFLIQFCGEPADQK
ncbi:hypothetical protein SAMN04488117_1263 [Celeribacter baekdonensis]|uniref:Uncharacterized protein n=1 Tax=Celeribacter baekdonensis TaxID=875171 RepID=A0A1G7UTB4_9RHOB|nr:hypothetical protein [Celeribacter baekdonensis]SDG50763.1 hypothetical protein SAMN04488117_1263 [Celeribacter baekdonensis]